MLFFAATSKSPTKGGPLGTTVLEKKKSGKKSSTGKQQSSRYSVTQGEKADEIENVHQEIIKSRSFWCIHISDV